MVFEGIALVASVVGVAACFWYVFLRREPPAGPPPTRDEIAWSRIGAAIQRAADELPSDGAEHALLLTLHDMMFPPGGAGFDEPSVLRTDQALQYALESVTRDRIARACLCEAQARMSTLRIRLAEERGWFGGVAAPVEEGPAPAVRTMRQVADLVELATRGAPEEDVERLRKLHKSLPTQEAPTAASVVRVEEEVGTLLDRLGESDAAGHLRSALRLMAEVKTMTPGAVQAGWESAA